jgi:hypothetical protein
MKPELVVLAVDLGVRPVRLRLPFRFGAVTLNACPQLFVRAEVQVGSRRATGHAAEMMVPKWFDKRPGFSQADNVAQLADSARRAADAYLGDTPATPFGLFERHYPALMGDGARAGATELTSAYGQAVLDRAVLDGLCAALGVSFFDAAAGNLLGLQDSALLPDLQGHDWNAWLRGLNPLHSIAARHTVGMLDALEPLPDDALGLPVSLPAVIARYGHRHFKIKLGGRPTADAERVAAVLAVLDTHAPGSAVTLDGNEQYADAAALLALFDALRAVLAAPHSAKLLYIEQPIAREHSFSQSLPWREAPAPLLMDEADGTLDAFAQGHALGWHGVSSKGCKGLYKAIANRARCERSNAQARSDGQPPRCFMSAEDLTCQAGLAVQQDLALAALLGLSHAERNGHHYAGGFGSAPMAEQQAFAAAHADLYSGTPAALRIEGGLLRIDSLFSPGFTHAASPDWQAMQPLDAAAQLL